MRWQSEWNGLLGTVPDEELAERVGVCQATVKYNRHKAGVAPHGRRKKLVYASEPDDYTVCLACGRRCTFKKRPDNCPKCSGPLRGRVPPEEMGDFLLGRARARFWLKVDKSVGACWLWTGLKDKLGYGRACARGGNIAAHRFAYQELIGPIPAGLVLDHLCRVTSCVNPAHLEPVTSGENSIRGMAPNMKRHRSGFCMRGHPLAENQNHRRMCKLCSRWHAQQRRARSAPTISTQSIEGDP